MIIGITGTLGAGKTTCVSFLEEKGFIHYSVRDFLVEHIKERGMPVDRNSMVVVANDLRANHGASYLAKELFKRAQERGGDVVIESLRAPAEITELRHHADQENPFIMLAIDAPVETRYERIKTRKSETDMISFEEFKTSEEREMYSDDPAKQNLAACIGMADVKIVNDGTKEEFMKRLEDAIWHNA